MTMKESGRQWRLRYGLSPASRAYVEAVRGMNVAFPEGDGDSYTKWGDRANHAWVQLTTEERRSMNDAPFFDFANDVTNWADGVLGEAG